MDFQSEQWYNGGFRGQAPRPKHGKGKGYRVKDLWCSVWYTRFIGSKEECEEWVKEHFSENPNCLLVEKWE